MLFTIIISAKFNNFLKIIFLIKFFDQPDGDEFDLIIILIPKSLQSNVQYIFA